MDYKLLLDDADRLLGTVITVEGRLLESGGRPYLGSSTADWLSRRCVRIVQDGIFDQLLDLIFPHTIGGGESMFYYPATVTGRVERDRNRGSPFLTAVETIRVDIHGEFFELKLV